jgi:hypothetical protein
MYKIGDRGVLCFILFLYLILLGDFVILFLDLVFDVQTVCELPT